jgi:hypothetical protein
MQLSSPTVIGVYSKPSWICPTCKLTLDRLCAPAHSRTFAFYRAICCICKHGVQFTSKQHVSLFAAYKDPRVGGQKEATAATTRSRFVLGESRQYPLRRLDLKSTNYTCQSLRRQKKNRPPTTLFHV